MAQLPEKLADMTAARQIEVMQSRLGNTAPLKYREQSSWTIRSTLRVAGLIVSLGAIAGVSIHISKLAEEIASLKLPILEAPKHFTTNVDGIQLDCLQGIPGSCKPNR